MTSFEILSMTFKNITDFELSTEVDDMEREFKNIDIVNIRDKLITVANEHKGSTFCRFLTKDLKPIAESNVTSWRYLQPIDLQKWAKRSTIEEDVYETVISPDKKETLRILTKEIIDEKYIIQIGNVISSNRAIFIGKYIQVFGWSMLGLLICGIILGWFGARKAMAGVKRITSTANSIGHDGFNHRVRLGREGEEIDNLAEAFNTMLDRIEMLMNELKDVTNNIAHDLRTPITRMRGLAEIAINNNSNRENQQEVIGVFVEECDRLVGIINTMLEIAEADAGLKKFSQVSVDMAALVKEGYEIFKPVAEDKGLELSYQGTNRSLYVSGNVPHLQRVISNILDNAIKFTRDGTIRMNVEKDGANIVISIQDTGIGIEESLQSRIFEKFYRIEASRSTPGNGLGLTFVKLIIILM